MLKARALSEKVEVAHGTYHRVFIRDVSRPYECVSEDEYEMYLKSTGCFEIVSDPLPTVVVVESSVETNADNPERGVLAVAADVEPNKE